MLTQDDFIQQLSEAPDLRGFFDLTTAQFTLDIERLVQRVFRKADFALKSVVDSLFEHQGPLADLSVRLKLLLGLGVLSAPVFEDINLILHFQQNELDELRFTSPQLIELAQQLHHLDLTPFNALRKNKPSLENKDSINEQIYHHRLDKVMRSSLILAVVAISEKLNVESPL